MNLAKLKTYAPAARNALITAVTRRAAVLGIQPARVEAVTESGDVALIAGQPFPRSIVPLRKKLMEIIQRDGFAPTMEAMAYTWFNRLVALRYMELHDGYLDHGYRVLSHPQGNPSPEVLQHAEHVELKSLDRDEVIRLKLDGTRDEELYRLLLLAQCAELNHILPDVFSKLDDATILLLPDNLLHSDSVIRQLVAGSDAEDWQQVEVLGWLYQFYISEKKDTVMARKTAVPTDDIPAVTQLFTPHWIVRYLVENSLGRLWLLNRPGARLREHMPYYIEGEAETDFLKINKPEEIRLLDPAVGSAHMLTYAFDLLYLIYEEEGYAANDIPGLILKHNLHGLDLCPRAAQLAELALVFKAREKSRRFFSEGRAVRPNILELCDVRFDDDELSEYLQAVDLDSYFENQAREWIEAGDLLARNSHFDASEAARDLLAILVADELLAPCLDSLDLDPRFHAKLRKLLSSGKELHGLSSRDNRDLVGLSSTETRELAQAAFRTFVSSGEILKYAAKLNLGDLSKQVHLKLFHQFEESKNFGSLIQPCLCEAELQTVRLHIQNSKSDIQNSTSLMVGASHLKVLRVLEQAEALTQRYHVVVANPPYMGSGQMNPALKAFAGDHYPDSNSDSFAMFMERGLALIVMNGFSAQVTMQTWMFLGSYEQLRKRITKSRICSCLQIGYNTFPELNSKIARGAAFVLSSQPADSHAGIFFNLNDAPQSADKDQVFLQKRELGQHHLVPNAFFRALPGCPIAFWISDAVSHAFSDMQKLGTLARIGKGLDTGCNEKFLRLWAEVSRSSRRWKPCQKGGPYRKWYGNHSFVVDWSEDGETLRRFPTGNLRNADCYFRAGITWTRVSSSPPAFRSFPDGFIFESTGPCVFPTTIPVDHVLAFLNSNTAKCFLEVVSPTLDFQSGHISGLPASADNLQAAAIGRGTAELVTLARCDWDNFETSWDFRDQPLLRPGLKGATLEASWQNWNAYCTTAVRRMQVLETENNRLFIAAYGLEGELEPTVPEEQITLARADARRDMAAILSYAVGCMMGRYSLDAEGLILADAGDTADDYLRVVNEKWAELDEESGITEDELIFTPDQDGIIPMLDGEWFEDDIVARTKEFLRATFDEATLAENLRFIEQSLGRELRDYFLTDFYKDHLQTYKNRPIYWLFSSGKQKAFQCLVYLHRYTPATLARIRTEYVIPLQGKLAARINRLDEEIGKTTASTTRKKLQTELDKLKKQMVELLAFDEQLRSYADQAITLDLDDGVKTNYAKFGPLVAESKKVCGTTED